jgi:competence protein ComEC
MLPSALAFLAGICLLLHSQRLPDDGVIALLALALPLCLCSRRLRWPALVLAGCCWSAWQAAQLTAIRLPPALEARDLQVRGQVREVPEQLAEDRLRVLFQIDSYLSERGWQALLLPVRLTWYRGAPAMNPGERWQLQVRLKAPHGLANPGGFDYQRWLFARGIRATGYVKPGAGNHCLAQTPIPPWQRLRQRLAADLEQLDLPPTQRALLRALAVGDRAAMSPTQWDLLAHTGTSHLLAISGLHVGLVASLVFFLVEQLWRRLGGGRWWASPRAGAVAAMLAALWYALLSGFQVPAQRAVVMIWLWMLALVLTGRAQPWRVLGLALWVILLLDPLSVLAAGFWLSFSAVALILFLSRGRYARGRRLQRSLAVQIGLVAGLTPVLWLWFQQASPTAPLANLVAIPWVGFVVVPVLLLGLLMSLLSPAASEALLAVAGWSLDALWRFLQLLDFGVAAQWYAPPLAPLGLMLSAVGLLVLLLPAATGLRGAALPLLLLPVWAAKPDRPAPGDLWLTLLDVGQGLAVVAETRRHVLVYDTGPAFPGGFDSGANVLVPFLRQRGYRRLDQLIISHGDNDHSGGAASLYRQFPAASVHSGEPRSIQWASVSDCHRQTDWQWDGVRFEYLSPHAATTANNASCVLKVTAADGRSVLLPGDIEQPVEAALLEMHPARLAARVLVAPHHGSRTSSSTAFIAAVRPDWVLFATGYRNRFGFPKADVVARYTAAGARHADTASAGAISVRIIAGKAIHVEGWRQQHRHLWQVVD